MAEVAEVAAWLERFAPSRMAEDWDNVGLLWGDPSAIVGKVMTCLTVTGPVAAEAVAEGVGLIVSHHPVLFRSTKSVRADRPEGAILWSLARAGVAVCSPHTAFDNTVGGINDGLARRLGLVEVGPLRPGKLPETFKIVVFTPASARDAVIDAAFARGAGQIGAYQQCSFSGPGQGTFWGGERTSPVVGQSGRRERVRERRVELVCPGDCLGPVLGAIRAAHPYEESALDVYPLRAEASGPGVGRLGRLPEPILLEPFARRVVEVLKTATGQVAGDPDRVVSRVAIGCGAGDDFLEDAARAGADVLVTGEARFHRALEAEALGVGLILAGHHATERPGVEDLAGAIYSAFPQLVVWASRSETDPLRPVPSVDPGAAKHPRRAGGVGDSR